MNKILINDTIGIDLSTLIDTRLFLQANSGGGKSWLLRRLLEQSHGKVRQIVIDLEGEFATLREKYDYIMAAKEGDTAADDSFLSIDNHRQFAGKSLLAELRRLYSLCR